MTRKLSAKKICYTALFMAMTIALSSFSIPVPGGHLYLCDTVICLGALLFDPFSAFLIGGVGSFLGDFIFYPTPMFVSLATHGIQAIVISLIVGKKEKTPPFWRSLVALLVGAIIMVTGYTLGRAYVYSTPEYSIIKLPYEIAQALIGVIVGIILLYKTPIKRLVGTVKTKEKEKEKPVEKEQEKEDN